MHEFVSNFFSKFGIRDQLNFANRSKWYCKTRQTSLQILVESNLLVLALSNPAENKIQDINFMIQEPFKNFFYPNCLDGDKLNSDSGHKWSFYMYQTGLQIGVKYKLLALVSLNMSYNESQDLYFLIHEFTKDFFQTLVLDWFVTSKFGEKILCELMDHKIEVSG